MQRDNFTLEYLATEMAKCLRRTPEYRKPPNDSSGAAPFRLVGIVDNHAVARRHGSALAVFPLKDYDSWPLVDKNGKPVSIDTGGLL